ERWGEGGGGQASAGRGAGFGAEAGHRSRDGIDACRGIATPVFAGCGMAQPDPDRDGYENHAVSLRAGFDAGNGWSGSARLLRSEGLNEYDADPAWGLPDRSRTLQQVSGMQLRHDAGGRLAWRLSAGRHVDRSDN